MKQIQIKQENHHHDDEGGERACMSRRSFLLAGGSIVALAAIPGASLAASAQMLKASYPRVKVGKLSELKLGVPLEFSYPYPNVSNILVKLGTPAGENIADILEIG